MSDARSRRILITGLSSWWGGRLAQVLEREPGVEALIGIDTADPRHELERTEFVRVATEAPLLRRIIAAAAIDTVIDTRLISDSLAGAGRSAREVNVVGTRELLSACAAAGSRVRKFVFKSAATVYGSSAGDPAFFGEEMKRSGGSASGIERDVLDAEQTVAEFAARNGDVSVSVLRAAEPLGGEPRGSHVTLLSLPVIPAILGFDPRLQFIHEDDVIGALAHLARHELPGTYNAAADGVLALSEIASLLGKPLLPVLPPWGAAFAAGQLRRLGVPVPVEMIRQLRYGRGLDNRRLKAAGYAYRYTTREALLEVRAQQRLRPLLDSGAQPYRYEREVEEFLRWSRSVQTGSRSGAAVATSDGAAPAAYDALSSTELIEIIPSLECEDLTRLREYEAAHGSRAAVLDALDRTLARKRDGSPQ